MKLKINLPKNVKWIEYQEEREALFGHIDQFDTILHNLESTANVYYSPEDKMWNILLKARDKLKVYFEKEKYNSYKRIEQLDEDYKREQQ